MKESRDEGESGGRKRRVGEGTVERQTVNGEGERRKGQPQFLNNSTQAFRTP